MPTACGIALAASLAHAAEAAVDAAAAPEAENAAAADDMTVVVAAEAAAPDAATAAVEADPLEACEAGSETVGKMASSYLALVLPTCETRNAGRMIDGWNGKMWWKKKKKNQHVSATD